MTEHLENRKSPSETRAQALLAEMTLEERMDCLSTQWKGVPRLGIAAFNFGGECLHGLCHQGRATVFPLPIGMAASFDAGLIERVAAAIACEARAKFYDPETVQGRFGSLAYWTPNINLFRDPRWGRGQETYGEDPYLTGELGAAFVRGLQGPDRERLRTGACAKHLAVHSGPEAIRTSFDARVSPKLLHETYLPHFKRLIEEGVEVVMGAYNALDGEPCCGSAKLLQEILREEWGFDGLVVSDAGAIAAFHRQASAGSGEGVSKEEQWAFLARQMQALPGHGVTADEVESAALAVNAGCDLALGNDLRPELLREALERGLLTEAAINRAAGRVLRLAARLGVLDKERGPRPDDSGPEVVQCAEHRALTLEAAQRSLVLLKNSGVLPLGRETKLVAVSGPVAADVNVLLGNFYHGVSGQLVTIVEGLVQAAPHGTTVTYQQGCELHYPNLNDSSWSIGLAEWADVVVAVLGNSPLMEGEHGEAIATRLAGDRDHLTLPVVQVDYLKRLKAGIEVPLVVIVTGGSPIVMPEVYELAEAVLLAWYPGEQGGRAVGDVIFGRAEPQGRLPVTLPGRVEDVPDFDDYSMRGRTYRYAEKAPAYPFGYGLTYTTFTYGPVELSAREVSPTEVVEASVVLRNTGSRVGTELVQLYVRACEDTGGPRCNLRGYQQVRLEPGASVRVSFTLRPEMLRYFDAQGQETGPCGRYEIWLAAHAPYAEPAGASFTVRG